MNIWSSLASVVLKVSSVFASLLLGPAAGQAAYMLAEKFNISPSPKSLEDYIKENPNAPELIKQLEKEKELDIKRIIAEMSSDTHQQSIVNEIIRAELSTTDKFKSYWRPLFGYIVAITWGIQSLSIVFGIVYSSVYEPTSPVLTNIAGLVQSMASGWMIALAVLGVNITQRSREKLIDQGITPGGILGTIGKVLKK